MQVAQIAVENIGRGSKHGCINHVDYTDSGSTHCIRDDEVSTKILTL